MYFSLLLGRLKMFYKRFIFISVSLPLSFLILYLFAIICILLAPFLPSIYFFTILTPLIHTTISYLCSYSLSHFPVPPLFHHIFFSFYVSSNPSPSFWFLLYFAVLSSLPRLLQMFLCGPWDHWWKETVGIRVCLNVCLLHCLHAYVSILWPVLVCMQSIIVCACMCNSVCLRAVLIHPIDQSRTPDSHHP